MLLCPHGRNDKQYVLLLFRQTKFRPWYVVLDSRLFSLIIPSRYIQVQIATSSDGTIELTSCVYVYTSYFGGKMIRLIRGVSSVPYLQVLTYFGFIGHGSILSAYDDVIKWRHFPRYWPFVRGIHRSPVNSPHKGQWCGALMFSLICVWLNGWVNNRDAGDLRRYRTHYDVSVMKRKRYGVIFRMWFFVRIIYIGLICERKDNKINPSF